MAAEDADLVVIGLASHRVTIQVHRVPEEVDPVVGHLGAHKDGPGRMRMEVDETSS